MRFNSRYTRVTRERLLGVDVKSRNAPMSNPDFKLRDVEFSCVCIYTYMIYYVSVHTVYIRVLYVHYLHAQRVFFRAAVGKPSDLWVAMRSNMGQKGRSNSTSECFSEPPHRKKINIMGFSCQLYCICIQTQFSLLKYKTLGKYRMKCK